MKQCKRVFWAGFLGLSLWAAVAAHAAPIENFQEYYKQNCEFLTGAVDGDDWCNRGNAPEKSPTVVMIGDSYSNSASTMLDEYVLTDKTGLVFQQYGHSQCPELIGYGPAWCSGFAQKVYEHIKKTKSIKTVVMTAAWSQHYLLKGLFKDQTPRTRAEFTKAFVETIKSYQALGIKVVVMYQTPYIQNPKVCVQRRIQIAPTQGKCELPLAQAYGKEEYRQFFDPTLAELKVEVFDPYVYLCDATECLLKEGDKIFHTAGEHMSGFGGQYLARQGHARLATLLAPPATPARR